MATKIVLFNHRGGVSKTTTSYNLGWMLALLGKRVLLVDADPQCNLSSLILGDDFEKYYLESETQFQNIKDGVKVAFHRKPKTIAAASCFSPPANNNLFLLAGHPDLSEYDAALSVAQNSNNAITILENLPGAFNELMEQTAKRYNIDFIVIDLSSGLTAINQNLFISSDAFIVPTNPDPFSIMAINTLTTVLPEWVDRADRTRPLFAEAIYPLAHSRPKFIGLVMQEFNVRYGHKASTAYRDNIEEIKGVISNSFVPKIEKSRMLFPTEAYTKVGIIGDGFCLLELKHFRSLLAKAYAAGVPVFALTTEQINTGGLKQDRDDFYEEFEQLAHKIIGLEEYAKCNGSI